jgi:hypothetical protein
LLAPPVSGCTQHDHNLITRAPAHSLIQIGRRPVVFVYRDGAHSLELQCDARANDLESHIADLLGELKLTW